jgi:glycosyltransferase involved in cell wall biosynthesis
LATKAIFVSKAVQSSVLKKQEFRATSDVIYNGVDTAKFKPSNYRDPSWRERFALPVHSVVFGQVSSLICRKGIDILLYAFQLVSRQHPETRLVLVGEGPERDKYMATARRLGINDKVVWVGQQADPLPYYQHVFDINVLASRNDAFPLSVLEAAACGLPNVAANVDGIPEAIEDGRTGLLFDRENHEMLAAQMSTLSCTPNLRKNLGMAARQVMVEKFSIERFCTAVQDTIVGQVKVFHSKSVKNLDAISVDRSRISNY